MSAERIVEHSRRAYSCERCGKPIKMGTRYRRTTYFPAEVEYVCGDRPLHMATHLVCSYASDSVAGQELDGTATDFSSV